MVYTQFTNLPNGQYYFTRKPYMDEYDLIDCDVIISQLTTVEQPYIKGIHKTTGKPLKQRLVDMDYMDGNKKYIIGSTITDVERERVKIIHRLKLSLQSYVNNILERFDTEISKSEFNSNIEKFPEALV